jgi:Uma2 family endonuclease
MAPVDVWVDATTLVQPDVVGDAPETAVTLDPKGYTDEGLVPELVVEVSSPSTRRLDLVWKRSLYERLPIREYWFADLDAGAIDVLGRDSDEPFGAPTSATGDEHVPSRLVDLDETVAELLAW